VHKVTKGVNEGPLNQVERSGTCPGVGGAGSITIYCGLFRSGFRSSDTRQCSGSVMISGSGFANTRNYRGPVY
jgi:hypothetical protein